MDKDKPIIEARNISKKYDISHMKGGYMTLRDVISNIVNNPFSFLKNKAVEAAGFKKKEEFWALKNISFEIKRGEVVGIIGSNGAGKSTLLKILSQITPPTEGEIILRGRVGSLLEVGTGFHPELTGRENIFLNGAILGMRKKEIEERFDEIVRFAGIEKFLDTPVKHYSSGMHVRLAFSVAAHMEPDILLVDEVLAVGDAEFQKKCLGKMDEITKKEGRTILFVSHNLSAIQELCQKCMLIDKGEIATIGTTGEVIEKYLNSRNSSEDYSAKKEVLTDTGEIEIINSWVENESGEKIKSARAGENIRLVLEYNSKIENKPVKFAIALINSLTHEQLTDLENGSAWDSLPASGKVVCSIEKLPLNIGTYSFNVAVRVNGFMSKWIKEAAVFDVAFGDFFGNGKLPDERQGSVLIKQVWKLE